MILGAVILFFVLIALLPPIVKSDNAEITVSTTNRDPLPAAACTESMVWYEDHIGWITNSSKMKQGLRTFYRETGVQPYVIITDQINGKGGDLTDSEAEDYLQKRYDELFQDEGHLLFLFLEYESSVYKEYLYLGNQASSVIDYEAQEIIYDFSDYYYTSDLDDNEFFATVFEKSAERIMRKTTTSYDMAMRFVLVFGTVVIFLVIGTIILKKKKLDVKEAEEKRKILETPIEILEDEALKDKYKD
ncbi:hypothetical protein [uncultured Clostridium sp.]|uniref:hypothetical protein n=1 Tax=uncultured Clostridium sp. TaxID=59620 RepID=UPI0025D7B9A6|nr:hypothetical protein [uncultured Clostridium sp.]